jgi:hypothetical protein
MMYQNMGISLDFIGSKNPSENIEISWEIHHQTWGTGGFEQHNEEFKLF